MNDIVSTWKSVKGIKTHETLVYSAYHDIRDVNEPIIRIIGVTRVQNPERLVCRIHYSASDVQWSADEIKNSASFVQALDIPAIITILPEHDDHEYHPCYISCPLNDIKFRSLKSNSIPRAVSLIPREHRKNRKNRKNWKNWKTWKNRKNRIIYSSAGIYYPTRLPIINSHNGGVGAYQASTQEVGLCLKPIHSNYSDWFELITFVELQKILGVSKIVVYNESMSKDVSCILRYYDEQEHLISVMAWDLYAKSNIRITSPYDWWDKKNNLRNRGGLASVNDCFYRNMNDYQYLFSVDLDEFIIPHIHETIPEMLQYLKSTDVNYLETHQRQQAVKNRGKKDIDLNVISSYNFLNSFFYQHYGNIFISCHCPLPFENSKCLIFNLISEYIKT